MFWMLLAEVIVPFTIDHAYVVAPAGPAAVLPVEFAQTCAGVGVIVGVAGLALTVNVAVVCALPAALVKVARYRLPLWPVLAVKLSVFEVARGISVKETPPLLETLHCTVGAGLPLADAVNVAV